MIDQEDEVLVGMKGHAAAALNGIKVLDMAEDRGLYVAKMLADLGADVIKIENPNGSPARHVCPFKNDTPGLESSLYFLNFNTNKRGITLNIESSSGQGIFKQLVRRSDILIEDSSVGRMHSLGLDYPILQDINRGLIMASLTGFGQAGPYAMYKAPDIVSQAMGGLMYVNGPLNAAPVIAPGEQSYYSVSAAAVCGILAALFLRLRTHEGQLIEASTHEVMATLAGGIMQYSNNGQIAQRSGSRFSTVPGRIYPCLDGYFHILTIRPNHWRGFLEVLRNPEILMGEEWLSAKYRNTHADIIDARVIEFTMKHTRMEIAELCQARGVPCTPVNTPADYYQDRHVQERGFFMEIEHPVIGRFIYPGPPCRLSKTPCRIERAAPLLGQHNQEVYCQELGYNVAELANFKASGIV
jgi:CoA:oxalate CoA-transferase